MSRLLLLVFINSLTALATAAEWKARRRIFLGVLLMALSGPAFADWNEVDYRDRGFDLRLDWDWLAVEKGSYVRTWSDGHNHQTTAAWWRIEDRNLELAVSKAAPGIGWSKTDNIDRRFLSFWSNLSDKEADLRGLEEVGCVEGRCVRFSAYDKECVGFTRVANRQGQTVKGVRGEFKVSGYYCAPAGEAEKELDNIIRAVRVEE